MKLSKRRERLYYRTVKCNQTIGSRLMEKEESWMNSISCFIEKEFTALQASQKWGCSLQTAKNRLRELRDAKRVKLTKIKQGSSNLESSLYQIIIDN